MNIDIDSTEDFRYNNEDESDMGQLHGAIHVHLNAIANVRRKMYTGPGRDTCMDCLEFIPLARRKALPCAVRCVHCQTLLEYQ